MSSRAIKYLAAALIVLAAIAGWCVRRVMHTRSGGGANDSPVHVAGGSINLKADNGWQKTSGSQFVSTDCVDVTLLQFAGTRPDGFPKQQTVAGAWTLRVFASTPYQTGPDTVGVRVRPDGNPCRTPEGSAGQHVTIEPIDSRDDSLDTGDDPTHEKKYRRANCKEKDPCNAMSAVELEDIHTFTCIRSKGCFVWIGKVTYRPV